MKPFGKCSLYSIYIAARINTPLVGEPFRIITHSFIEKAELEQQLKPNLRFADYEELLEAIWDPLVEQAYSFIVNDESKRTIGVALNFDANNEPEPPLSGALETIFIFLDKVETPIR